VAAAIYSADGVLIADGAHNRLVSSDHAEVVAIKKAGASAQGATIVVSLEPCNHTGATGPCVDAIINSGISTVIYAVKDPNPMAAGGAERLQSAGIDVQYIESEQLLATQGAWLHRIEKGRPYFIWKVATTLDGRIAARDGSSQWITGREARGDVQCLRAQSDAILIGTGTALADNPTLRARLEGIRPAPRIVMGMREIPQNFTLNDGIGETHFLRSHDHHELLNLVNQRGFNQVLVEAGPTLGSALFAAGVIDEVILYQAPIVLGSGMSWLSEIGVANIGAARELTLLSHEQIGPDMKFRYRVENR
ncbi:MAG: bifunctional diaminohydroxyphosphoribosylaminopyrimidine deaminase/5-amino-6-(5-phosphoribosylamino)uracil reductase RibD, partial [Candidatus Planktophila sp.]